MKDRRGKLEELLLRAPELDKMGLWEASFQGKQIAHQLLLRWGM